MGIYRTSEVAKIIGIHPNTVRLYEEWGMIPRAERQANGYRVFTDFHIEQLKLARRVFQIEVLQNGLRKRIIEAVKLSANKEFDKAVVLAKEYLKQIHEEKENAEEAAEIARRILDGKDTFAVSPLKRKETADFLNISIDTIRNWELNGLLNVKRMENGYRVYSSEDINRLKMIRSLRCANYSLVCDKLIISLQEAAKNAEIMIKTLKEMKGKYS